MKTRKYLWSILLFGAILRFTILNRHDFWFDEAYSLYIAKFSVAKILFISTFDTHPPLYYLLLNIWQHIHSTPIFLRSLSLALGIITIGVSYHLGKLFYSEKVALLASALLAVSPLHIYFSVETRTYSLWTLEVFLLIYYFFQYIKKQTFPLLLGYISLGILAFYTHYSTGVILLSLNLLCFIYYRSIFLSKRWLFAQIIIFIPITVLLKITYSKLLFACHCFPFYIAIPAAFASFAVNGLGIISLKALFAQLSILTIMLGISIILTLYFFSKGTYLVYIQRKSLLPLYLLLLPMFLTTLISFLFPIFSPRGFIPLMIFYYLLISYWIINSRKTVFKIFTIIIFSVTSSYITQQYPYYTFEPLQRGAQLVTQQVQNKDVFGWYIYPGVLMKKYTVPYIQL